MSSVAHHFRERVGASFGYHSILRRHAATHADRTDDFAICHEGQSALDHYGVWQSNEVVSAAAYGVFECLGRAFEE
jgi:hypothetical protein